MATHKFGGDRTSDKLERVRKYLCAYTTIFRRNPRAAYFRTIYVDAFAGTGFRSDSKTTAAEPPLFGGGSDPDADSFKKGSARIALEVDPPFDHYIFIERDSARVDNLVSFHA